MGVHVCVRVCGGWSVGKCERERGLYLQMCSYTYDNNNTWKIIITDIHSEWLRLTFGFDESSDALLEIQVHNCGKS